MSASLTPRPGGGSGYETSNLLAHKSRIRFMKHEINLVWP